MYAQPSEHLPETIMQLKTYISYNNFELTCFRRMYMLSEKSCVMIRVSVAQWVAQPTRNRYI